MRLTIFLWPTPVSLSAMHVMFFSKQAICPADGCAVNKYSSIELIAAGEQSAGFFYGLLFFFSSSMHHHISVSCADSKLCLHFSRMLVCAVAYSNVVCRAKHQEACQGRLCD